MGFEAVRRRVPPAAVLVAVLLLVPQPGIAQESSSEDSQEPGNLKTSLRGSLQHRLAAAYPDWFREGVDIFWEPNDGWVSPEVFDWWLSCLPEEDHDGLKLRAAERVFSRISAQSPVFSGSGECATCAVVGASGNLLESQYGEVIDVHDVVMRVNQAPTYGFESDVGITTTHHVMWPRYVDEGKFDRRAFLLLTPVAKDIEDIFDRIFTVVEDDLRWDPERVRIIHPEFVKYLHENWTRRRGRYPSTGFIAMMIAVHICDEVDVFGFGADVEGGWDHYYDDWRLRPSDIHAVDLEEWLRMDLERNGILTVFHGSRLELLPDTDESSHD